VPSFVVKVASVPLLVRAAFAERKGGIAAPAHNPRFAIICRREMVGLLMVLLFNRPF
jgi:hypothetical protein